MNIFNRFRKKPGSGANPDTRSAEEKEKDYTFEETVAAVNPVIWEEKDEIEWRKFPIFNQDGSGSCVAQTMAKLLGVLYWLKNQIYVHFSATHIYQRRANKPGPGMMGVDAFNMAKQGVTLEELTPSQGMTDAQMDEAAVALYKQQVGEIFKISNFVTLPTKDIDTIASVIQTTQKAVMVWFYFTYAEWTNEPAIQDPNLDQNAQTTCRHSVTATDYFLRGGKKCLLIEDSWGAGYGYSGRRIITEDFFKVRNWFAAYPIAFKFDESTDPNKPHYTFNTDLQYGDKNADVKALQEILKYEGLYPTNIDNTGLFGAITKKSVQAFQDKYNIAHAGDSGYGRVGPKTRTKLNEIYS